MFVLFATNSFAENCLNWFIKADLLSKSESCELQCNLTPVDMGTFSCTSQCEDFCSKSLTELALQYVPRLTEGDKKVLSKLPAESMKVFIVKEQVNNLTRKIFKNGKRSD